MTDREIRFGIAAPFSGSARELGRQMKLGIDTAFSRVNEAGGVDGWIPQASVWGTAGPPQCR